MAARNPELLGGDAAAHQGMKGWSRRDRARERGDEEKKINKRGLGGRIDGED